MTYVLSNVRALRPDGSVASGSIGIEHGRVCWFTNRVVPGVDAGGLLALPGIVDLHGDALERQLMPRPGVAFPPLPALVDTDRQLLANGITTAFHALTLSWEPGLRGAEAMRAMLKALEAARPRLGCDTRLHLRFEILAFELIEEILDWLADGRIDLLSFNDHSRDIAEHRLAGRLGAYTGRTGLDEAGYLALFDSVCSRRPAAHRALERLAAAARRTGIAIASHDDASPDERDSYRRLGCAIAEFPVDLDTARGAAAIGDATVLGAPNVVRGGSHVGRLDAAQAIAEGSCSILTSDYYYPSLLQAPFMLAARGILPFGEAWNLVSRNPAQAAGLVDRGTLEPGMRADLVLVDDRQSVAIPAATLVAGIPHFLAGALVPGLVDPGSMPAMAAE